MTDRLTRLLVTQRDIEAEDPLRSGEELHRAAVTSRPVADQYEHGCQTSTAVRRTVSTLLGAAKSLKGLSHLPQLLLWLDRARVHFPPLVRFVGAGVNAAIALEYKPTKTSMRRRSLYVFRFICGDNVIRPRTDPTAGRTVHFFSD